MAVDSSKPFGAIGALDAVKLVVQVLAHAAVARIALITIDILPLYRMKEMFNVQSMNSETTLIDTGLEECPLGSWSMN